MRSIVALARATGRIAWEIDVKSPTVVAYRDTRGPGDAGWDAMRALAKRDTAAASPRAYRDRAMLRVDHDLGLRVSELVGLDVEHVERDDRRPAAVWVLRKGRTERERKTLPAATGAALEDWMTARGDLPGPLFLRLDSAIGASPRLTAHSVYAIVGRLGRRAGIARRVSPHQLRHHAISCVLERNGGDVVKGQEFSGHKNLATLSIYLDHLKDRAGEMANLIADDD